MVYAGIILADVQLEAVAGAVWISPQDLLYAFAGEVCAAPFDAGVGVCRVEFVEDRLQHVHNSVVDDAVGIVWETGDGALLRIVYLEEGIAAGLVVAGEKKIVEPFEVFLAVAVEKDDAPTALLPLPRLVVSEAEVFDAANLAKK